MRDLFNEFKPQKLDEINTTGGNRVTLGMWPSLKVIGKEIKKKRETRKGS